MLFLQETGNCVNTSEKPWFEGRKTVKIKKNELEGSSVSARTRKVGISCGINAPPMSTNAQPMRGEDGAVTSLQQLRNDTRGTIMRSDRRQQRQERIQLKTIEHRRKSQSAILPRSLNQPENSARDDVSLDRSQSRDTSFSVKRSSVVSVSRSKTALPVLSNSSNKKQRISVVGSTTDNFDSERKERGLNTVSFITVMTF